MWVAFAKATHIFSSKNISLYAIFNDQSFNDTLANDIVGFEQLDPDLFSKKKYFNPGVNKTFSFREKSLSSRDANDFDKVVFP